MWSSDLVSERDEEDWKFYIEAIQAWRAWRVVELDGVILLQSITYRVNWIPRQEMVSECRNSRKSNRPHVSHLSPNINHGCGIYTVKEQRDAIQWRRYPSHTDTVVYGRASIWGNVFQFTKGYISEYAYPAFLFVPHDIGEELQGTLHPEELAYELSNSYGVESVVV